MRKERQEDETRDLLTMGQVEEVVRERMLITGVIKPTAIVEGGRGRQMLLLEDLGATSEDRALKMLWLGYDIGRNGAVGPLLQLTFIAEAWYTTATSEGAILPPSRDPHRKECIVIAQARLEDQSTTVRLLRIVRDSADEFQMLVPLDTGPDRPEKLDSPLINAFLYGFWAGSTPSPAQNHPEKRH